MKEVWRRESWYHHCFSPLRLRFDVLQKTTFNFNRRTPLSTLSLPLTFFSLFVSINRLFGGTELPYLRLQPVALSK